MDDDIKRNVEAVFLAMQEASRSAMLCTSLNSRSDRLSAKQSRAMKRRGSPEIVARLRARVAGSAAIQGAQQ